MLRETVMEGVTPDMPNARTGLGATMFQEDEHKFEQLMLYIASQSADDPRFASTNLNKLLFACDMFAYGLLGKPITGFRYIKERFGPVPRRLLTIRDEMISRGDLALQEMPCGAYKQKRPIPLSEPKLAAFTSQEIALVDQVLKLFRKATAARISEWSHGLCGWAIADNGDDIPYEVVFLSDQPMTAYDAERGRQLALERGWDVF